MGCLLAPILLKNLFFLTWQALRVICQDMFFSRSRNTPSATNLAGSNIMESRRALESALTGVRNADDRMNVIGELVDMKVDSPVNMDYSSQVNKKRP